MYYQCSNQLPGVFCSVIIGVVDARPTNTNKCSTSILIIFRPDESKVEIQNGTVNSCELNSIQNLIENKTTRVEK